MKCFICENEKARAYYSPKALFRFNIFLCNKCIKDLKGLDLIYIENTNKEYAETEVKKLIKKR